MVPYVNPELIEPHYSTRIYRGFVAYLLEKLGEERLRSLLAKTGVPLEHLQDGDNWVSETFAESFYEALEECPGLDPDYSFRAARAAVFHERNSAVYLWALSMLGPAAIYVRMQDVATRFNKMETVSVRRQGPFAIHVVVSSRRETRFMHQIAESWRGLLSAVPILFGYGEAEVKVDRVSENTVEFTASWIPHWLAVAANLAVSAGPVVALIGMVGYLLTWLIGAGPSQRELAAVTALSGLGAMALGIVGRAIASLRFRLDSTSRLESILSLSAQRYQELLDSKKKLDRRYQEANLLREVVRRISSCETVESIIDTTLAELRDRLRYDRVAFMMHMEGSNLLKTSRVLGLSPRDTELFESYTINLAEVTESPLHIGNVFKNCRSVLIPVVADYFDSLSEQGKLMLYITKSRSFLAVPVHTEKQQFGLLLVDYETANKVLTEDDLHVVENVANQLAISMQLLKNLENERQLRETFQQFVPRQVVNRMLVGETEEYSRGLVREVSVLFADLRDFTQNSTRMEPSDLLGVLNRYFSRVTEIVYRHEGIVDKFLGDGVLAVFNAFGNTDDHSIRAALAACELVRVVPELNKEVARNTGPNSHRFKLKVGIGLHVGDVAMCTVGNGKKTEFTCIGETVNIAARLQGLAKDFPEQSIIASRAMTDRLLDHFHLKELGRHPVRGVEGGVELSGIMGERLRQPDSVREDRTFFDV
jgi:class 3 adenylate cyclase